MGKVSKIFKYCSIDVSTLILENNEILLNEPKNFNDPYDTNILLDEKDLSKAKDILINYSLDIAMKEVIKNYYKDFKWWQKIIAIPAKGTIKLQEITNRKNKEYKPILNYSRMMQSFTSMGLKNGTKDSESQIALNELIKTRNSGVIEETLSESIMDTTNNLLITCFSKIPDSMLMWSHYADNSKGVCLEYENEDYLDVQYSNKRGKFIISKVMYKILWYYHSREKEQKSEKEMTSFLIAITPFLTKSNVWSYEEEVRAIYSKNSMQIIEKDGQFFYKMKRLISITLGYRVSEIEKCKFIEFSQKHKIRLYQMELSHETFDLIRKEIEL
jgi:hypothetical protein